MTVTLFTLLYCYTILTRTWGSVMQDLGNRRMRALQIGKGGRTGLPWEDPTVIK